MTAAAAVTGIVEPFWSGVEAGILKLHMRHTQHQDATLCSVPLML